MAHDHVHGLKSQNITLESLPVKTEQTIWWGICFMETEETNDIDGIGWEVPDASSYLDIAATHQHFNGGNLLLTVG